MSKRQSKTEFYSSFTFNSKNELLLYIRKYAYKEDGRINQYVIYPHLSYIKSLIPNCTATMCTELVYWLENDLEDYPKCAICDNKVTNFYAEYNKTCCNKCLGYYIHQNMSEKTKLNSGKKISEALKNKTDDEWKDITKKRENTTLEKYGETYYFKTDNFKNKSKQTWISKYGVDHPQKSKIIKDKTKTTCLEKYGVNTPSQSNEIKNKIKQTCLEKYGVNSYTQSDDFKIKSKNTHLEKYGIDNISKLNYIKDKKIATCLKNNNVKFGYFLNKCSGYYSKSANLYFEEIYDQLHEDDQDCTYTMFLGNEFNLFDVKTNRNYFYDFVCTSLKICIEFQGDYWHMNPAKYSPNDFNVMTQLTAQEHWYNDLYKKNLIESKGYTIYYIWENDIK